MNNRLQKRLLMNMFSLKYRCVLCLIILVIGSSKLYSKNADQHLQEVTLQLKWKHQFQFAGYYAAIEKGYFQEVGINVKLLEAVDSVDENNAVFNGNAQFGITTSEVILLRTKGKDPVVLASVFQHSPVILLSLEKSGIKHALDLIGKRLALETNSHEMAAYLTSEGVPLDRCIMVRPTFDLNQLINNEVDAISTYSTDMPFQLEELNINYTVISPLMGGLDFYGDVLFTTASLIKKDPVLVANFRQAALKGWKYALDHQDEMVDLIYNKYSQRHSKEYLMHEAEHMKSLIMKDMIEIGYSNPERWQHILEIYQKLNLTSKSQTINGLLYADYLGKGYTIPWKLINIFLLIIIFVCSVTWFFYNTSKKLKIEIKNRMQVQNDLAASEEHYRSVIAASPDTIVITDLNGVVQFVSSMVKKMFGYNMEEIVNQPILKYIDPIHHAKAQSAIGQMFSGTFMGATEYKAIKSDGSLFDIELNGEFIRDAAGKPVHMVFVARDISDRKATEEKLRKSEETYRKLIESINEVVYEISSEGKIKYVSPAVERVLGYRQEELIGRIMFGIIHPDDRQDIITKVSNLGDRKYSFHEYRMIDKNQAVIWVRSSTSAIYNNDVLTGGTGSFTDITDRKLAEEKMIKANRFYLFISKVNEAIIVLKEKQELYEKICQIAIEYGKFRMAWIGLIDPQTNILEPVSIGGFENGYLSEIRKIRISNDPEGRGPGGSAAKEGMHFVCNDIENDPRMVIWKEAALQRSYRSSIALPIKQLDETIGVVSLYSSLPGFFDQEETELLDKFSDNISFAINAIEIEKEKNDLYNHLELKVRERTAQLAILNANLQKEIEDRKKAEIESSEARLEAEKANIAKSEFLSRMSHELRTPMNSILGFAQLLQMGELTKSQKKGVAHILRSGKHLLDLINEVLDITRIEAGKLTLSIEPVQINSLVPEMIDTLKPLARERHVHLEFIDSPENLHFVKADRQRLKQVLLNLIANGIKYNRVGGSVVIYTEILQPDHYGIVPVRISVRDTGYGISEENLHKLFSPFERIGAERSDTEGSGLGLVVVKKLLDAMNGRVGVECKLNEGSSFWIELPMTESLNEAVSAQLRTENAMLRSKQKSGSILYIEDNVSNIELVEQVLANHRPNIKLIVNNYGKHALRLANENQPFLILLDLNLPDIHGDEVLLQLKEDETTSQIPVIVISADAMPKQIQRLMSIGAENYLTKPIDVIAFLKVIDKFIPI